MEPIADLAPTASAAFDAAYDALMPYTQHAQSRADIAERIVRELLDRRAEHGMGLMLAIAQAPDTRTDGGRVRGRIVGRARSGRENWWPPQSIPAVGAAVKAAARVLAEG